jgi:hypothetical protein
MIRRHNHCLARACVLACATIAAFALAPQARAQFVTQQVGGVSIDA